MWSEGQRTVVRLREGDGEDSIDCNLFRFLVLLLFLDDKSVHERAAAKHIREPPTHCKRRTTVSSRMMMLMLMPPRRRHVDPRR